MQQQLPDDFYFSQLALNVFKQCPLKFRFRYLDQLYWPESRGSREKKQFMERGMKFHRLARNYYDRGVAKAGNLQDKKLQKWFESLRGFCPYNEEDRFQPEFELRINCSDVRLLAKYDLLYINNKQNEIFIYDWKTNKKPLSREKLGDSLQTSVYLLVLSQAVNRYFSLDKKITPGDLKIVYWNPRFPQKEISLGYSIAEYTADKEKIKNLISIIKNMSYEDFSDKYNKKSCSFCQYSNLCQK